MRSLSKLCVLVAFLATTNAALAETCTSPDLAPGFCDRNGNMVADPPDDKSQWLDPNPVVIADVPGTVIGEAEERVAPILRHLEKLVGRKFAVFEARDYSELNEAFKANRVHLVNPNTGSVEHEVRCNGYVPVAQPKDVQGNPDGYQMEILVAAGSPIKNIRDIKGRKLTFVDEKSASGYKAPRAILAEEFGLEAGKDYQFEFSGRQDNSVMGLANGIYEVIAVANTTKSTLVRNKLVDPKAFRTLYVSKTFPHSPFGVSHRMNPALVAKIQDAFIRYVGPEKVLVNGSRFRPANYKADWAFMRQLSAAAGYKGNCK